MAGKDSPGQECKEKTAREYSQERIARKGHLEKNSQERKSMKGQPGKDSQDNSQKTDSVRTGLPGNESQDRTISKEQPRKDRAARTGQNSQN
jgi:hypothetical protein